MVEGVHSMAESKLKQNRRKSSVLFIPKLHKLVRVFNFGIEQSCDVREGQWESVLYGCVLSKF